MGPISGANTGGSSICGAIEGEETYCVEKGSKGRATADGRGTWHRRGDAITQRGAESEESEEREGHRAREASLCGSARIRAILES